MNIYRSIFWLNGLCLLLVFALIAHAKLFNSSVGGLFLPPPSPEYPSAGLLTHSFQLLCCVPPLVCAFSLGLLKKISPRNQNNKFIFYSSLLTTGFLLNEIYRIHIIFLQVGIPKLVTICFYAIIAISYGLACWRQIKSTPYFLLTIGISLLFIAIAVDSLHLNGNAIPSLLEGIPKLFSGINVALYFWVICYEEVLNSLKTANSYQ
ncbi:hypothetical protein IQ276_031450 [Desmonostoc muscorum LEGE 12446]|uniref:DUF998 domain-containing protein n=1 Tax=Desmonostoc muscorum LEGE 12446 TaxID=1828758 RepID=A0A8J7D0D6_DESMC|nr:hypothetical protein [Desmonostoc muscorum]MCF2150862.1 hypothetical protein [Desmonostoc muscorum LEGE 12446]